MTPHSLRPSAAALPASSGANEEAMKPPNIPINKGLHGVLAYRPRLIPRRTGL
jgi:hypothetical protein